MASRITALSRCCTKVLMAKRRAGAVAIIDKSRMPDMAMFKVLGIGVAVRVRISTSARSDLNFSFWRTPKRCSSSMITKPKSLNCTASLNNLCVPTTMSTLPEAIPSSTDFCALPLTKREITSILNGRLAKRSLKFS